MLLVLQMLNPAKTSLPIRLQGLILFDGQRRLADFGGN